jgi:hypothetical protein
MLALSLPVALLVEKGTPFIWYVGSFMLRYMEHP